MKNMRRCPFCDARWDFYTERHRCQFNSALNQLLRVLAAEPWLKSATLDNLCWIK